MTYLKERRTFKTEKMCPIHSICLFLDELYMPRGKRNDMIHARRYQYNPVCEFERRANLTWYRGLCSYSMNKADSVVGLRRLAPTVHRHEHGCSESTPKEQCNRWHHAATALGCYCREVQGIAPS